MRLPLMLLFLTSLSSAAFSNFKLLPGYYIEKSGDSVSCKIEFSDWYANPKTIEVEVGAEKKTLGVEDIRGFGIYGYNDYRSASVTYHTNPTTGIHITDKYSDSTETANVFLRILAAGSYSLYELVLPQRFYYFVEEKDGEISELVYRVRQKNIVLEEDKQYVNALNLLFIKEGIFDRYSYRISVSTYNGTSLKSLVDLLNGAHMGVEVKRPREKLFQLDVFAGALVNTFPNKFDGRFAMGNKFSSSTSFSGGLNFMYTFPNNFRSLMIGASLGYDQYSASLDKPGDLIDSSSPNNIHTVHYEEKFSVRSSFILIPNIYVVYVLNPTNKIKGYVKAGFCVNLNLGNDLDVHSNYGGYGILIDARDKVPHVNVGLGVIAGKNKAELAYYIPSGMTTDSVPFNMGMIGFSYYFTVL